jgi:hypothetical protein
MPKMKYRPMTRLILIATVFILVSVGGADAFDENREYQLYTTTNCSEVLSAHALIGNSPGEFKPTPDTFRLLGYVAGWATAINSRVEGKRDYFLGVSVTDMVSWIGSWCRSNPNHRLSDAMDALTAIRLR